MTRLGWFPASEATDPEHCDDFLSVPVLPDASKFVVKFVEILTEVRIHGLLSDACTLDTCSVADDRLTRSLAS